MSKKVKCPECAEEDNIVAIMQAYDHVELDEDGRPTTSVVHQESTDIFVEYECYECHVNFDEEKEVL